MTLPQSLAAFVVAGGVLTVTPGLDTALVLRAAAGEGRHRAAMAVAAGVAAGCLAWGIAVAFGLGALLAASATAYAVLRICGAAYLVWVGVGLLRGPRGVVQSPPGPVSQPRRSCAWLRRGLFTNLLNPKVGLFYVSFLPQFVPDGMATGPAVFGLAVLHALMATAWFSLLVLGVGRLGTVLQRPDVAAGLDRLTGATFVGFGLRLAFERR